MMKKILAFILLLISYAAQAGDIYVSSQGNDRHEGSAQQPKATVAAALRTAREWRRLNDERIKGGIHIWLQGGTYQLNEPVFIRPEDAGTADSPTWIEAMPGAQPVISGGVSINGWQKAGNINGLPKEAKGKVWVADVPLIGGRPFEFRQLWINDQKATRARDLNGDSMNRILSWDKINQSCWIPAPKGTDLTKAPGLEMIIHQWWAIAILRVSSVKVQGDSAQLLFHQPESRIQSEHPWPSPWISKKTGNSAFYLTNAIQLLNKPGEWYLDLLQHKLYYWPTEGQDMNTATVTAPYLETLVRIEGVADAPVSHVHFKGINFQHSSWLRPSQQGHVPLQAGMYLLDAYHLDKPGTPDKKGLENQAWTGRPSAAVSVTYANHTRFENCSFAHLAATGLDYVKGTYDDEIKGNVFTDIGGTGIQVGTFSEDPVEAHLPYDPTDERIICTNTSIQNNLIYNCTNEDWGCVGIGAGFVKGINIAHNEIADVSYSGISLGWGWTKTVNTMRNNRVFANHIHHYAKWMYDVAGIYTLSAQPGSVISNNCIDSIYKAPYAHLPEHWFYLYTDEGTSYITVKDNWCPEEKFLRNANGPGNTWSNNGPNVTDSIKQSAGLEPAYQYLRNNRQLFTQSWPINHHTAKFPYAETPSIIECKGVTADKQTALRQVILQQGLDAGALYQWKDHVILFQPVNNVTTIVSAIQQQLPGVTVKTYSQPYSNNCLV